MRGPRTLIAALGVAAVLVSPLPAEAHGPCRTGAQTSGCLEPPSGPPGTRVTILGTAVYRAVWNENVPYDSQSLYRRAARTLELLNIRESPLSTEVARRVQFVVPEVAPGDCPIAIYDGAEGGSHYTWDVFSITAPSASGRFAPVWLLPAGGVLLAAAIWLGLRRR